ncbi:MAG: ComF family protein [Caulobacteraceae bacterium]
MAGRISLAPTLRRAASRTLDILLPPRPLDERPAWARPIQGYGLSAEAWSGVAFIDWPFCEICGAPLDHAQPEGLACAACQARRPAFDRARAACLYDARSRDLILQLKHADRTDLAGLFAKWLARAARDLLPECEAVVPVPLHRSRLFARRYNQAAEIARPLARSASIPYLADALRRERATPSQGGRSRSGRRRNVSGAFTAARADRIRGRRLLLVDDVITTGATIEACARALKAAGAARVDAVAIARVPTLEMG